MYLVLSATYDHSNINTDVRPQQPLGGSSNGTERDGTELQQQRQR